MNSALLLLLLLQPHVAEHSHTSQTTYKQLQIVCLPPPLTRAHQASPPPPLPAHPPPIPLYLCDMSVAKGNHAVHHTGIRLSLWQGHSHTQSTGRQQENLLCQHLDVTAPPTSSKARNACQASEDQSEMKACPAPTTPRQQASNQQQHESSSPPPAGMWLSCPSQWLQSHPPAVHPSHQHSRAGPTTQQQNLGVLQKGGGVMGGRGGGPEAGGYESQVQQWLRFTRVCYNTW